MSVLSDHAERVSAHYLATVELGPNAHSRTARAYRAAVAAMRQDLRYVVAHLGKVVSVDIADPYASNAAMAAAARASVDRTGPAFLVSSVACTHPHWSADDNVVFRMHHDSVHVGAGYPAFSLAGEVATWFETCERLRPYVDPDLFGDVRRVLWVEIVGQSCVFDRTDKFPTLPSGSQAIPFYPFGPLSDILESETLALVKYCRNPAVW